MSLISKIRIFTAAAGVLCLTSVAHAQQRNAAAEAPVRVSARIDSAATTLGSRVLMHVEVLKPAGKGVMYNLPRYMPGKENDFGGAEVREITVDSTPLPDKRMQVNYSIQLQPFNVGNLTFPAFKYVVDADTFYSEVTTLKVLEPNMPKMMRDSLLINPMEGTVSIKARWYDFVPSWWYWVLLGLAVAGLAIALVYLYRKNGPTLLPRKKVIPPHVVALESLDRLKARHLPESGQDKAYYTELTDILRTYLHGRFHINAREMTSTEILQALDKNPKIADWHGRMATMLATSDFVKFAKVRPTPQENTASFDTVLDFVQQTKPAEPDPNSPEGKALARQRRRDARYDKRVDKARRRAEGKQSTP